MKSKWFKLSLVGVVVAILAVLGIGAVTYSAFAQGPQPGQGTPAAPGGGPRGGPPMGGHGPASLAVIAKTLGMSEADLLKELQAGKSVADVAKAKNVALDKVVDAIIADRVADMKANLPKQLSEPFRPGPGGPAGPGPRGMFGGPGGASLATVAKELGISEADLLTALQAGKTVADVAKEKNVALDKIVNAIVAQMSENLKKAVSDGRMTQAQADKMLADLKASLPQRLSEKLLQPPPFGPGGPQGGRPPFGPGGPQPQATPGTR